MERKYKIISNKAQCKVCKEIIESKSVHDFQGCKCFRETLGEKGIAVDGGDTYLKRSGQMENLIELSETRPFTDDEQIEYEQKIREQAVKYGLDISWWK